MLRTTFSESDDYRASVCACRRERAHGIDVESSDRNEQQTRQ